jgi:hypothetical protein
MYSLTSRNVPGISETTKGRTTTNTYRRIRVTAMRAKYVVDGPSMVKAVFPASHLNACNDAESTNELKKDERHLFTRYPRSAAKKVISMREVRAKTMLLLLAEDDQAVHCRI